jgi:diaminohydroxyphosphoribosylaminopyrimidine deaminase/5-amino-6-(5-phosphoribosylamino)uracil reductase
VFDRRLRTPPAARLFSTLPAGPVIILTTAPARREQAAAAAALERAGATVIAVREAGIAAALRELAALDIQSLLIEGGAALHAAAWDEGVVDYVQQYVGPSWLGPTGVPWLDGRAISSSALFERHVEPLGPDVLIEGYVHRPD